MLDIRIAAVADQRAGRIAVAAVADDQWLEAAQPLGDAEHIAILEAAALRILAVDRDLEFGGGAPLDRADQPVADLRRLLGAEAARSAERRVGKEWVSTCRAGWSPSH